MNKKLALAALLASATAFSAQAAEPNYSYVQAGYNWAGVSPDVGDDIDLNGWNLTGSLEFAEHFYGFAGYQDSDGDDFNAARWNLGFGYKTNIADNTSWYAQAKYINESLEDGPFSIDESDSGWGIGTGVRGMVNDHFELQGGINYTSVNGVFGDGFGIGLGAMYHINETWGLNLAYGYDWRDDFNISDINFGVRASF